MAKKNSMKKENLGALILLGGIAFIAFIWFKRNKPKIADTQLSNLAIQSGNLETAIDIPFSEQGTAKTEKDAIAQQNWNLWSVPLTPSQIAEMEKAGYKGSEVNTIMYQFMNMDLRGI